MTTDPSSGQPASTPASYEAALSELDAPVASMEAVQLPLEGPPARYRRGSGLLPSCHSRLEAVEPQVKVLEGGPLKAWPQT